MAYWDDWMRRPDVREGRQCLRPEICRTYNFGEHGSSGGQFYYSYLVPIKLNTADVPWRKKVRGSCCKRLPCALATASPKALVAGSTGSQSSQ